LIFYIKDKKNYISKSHSFFFTLKIPVTQIAWILSNHDLLKARVTDDPDAIAYKL
jgi:hypothetical protein